MSIYSLGTTALLVPVGATLALFLNPTNTRSCMQVKLFSGGTLEMIGAPYGTTLSATELAAASGNHYIFSLGEAFSVDGPTPFYLSATGATCRACVIYGRSPGP